jgi:Rrf2 family protein
VLSATSEYALRALAQLARLTRGHVMLGRDLAGNTGVPPKYLSKVMLALRNAGLIAATRGTGGGYMLLRPADAICLIDVVRLFEQPAEVPQCLLRPSRECSDKNACTAHARWSGVRRGYLEFLENTTLNDISLPTPPRTQLTRSARVHN